MPFAAFGAGDGSGNGGSGADVAHDLSKIAARAKCATVTMMLAERIARNDWSVDGEHLVNSNHPMNLWQTLEYLSGANLRKRYHYEGYNDTENAVRTLTPSWRRDSFVDKNAEEGVGTGASLTPRPSAVGTVGASVGNDLALPVPILSLPATSLVPKAGTDSISKSKLIDVQKELKLPSANTNQRKEQGNPLKCGKKKKITDVEIDPVYTMSPLQYTDIIKCK